jgi:hypothetical protein
VYSKEQFIKSKGIDKSWNLINFSKQSVLVVIIASKSFNAYLLRHDERFFGKDRKWVTFSYSRSFDWFCTALKATRVVGVAFSLVYKHTVLLKISRIGKA